VTHRIQNLRLLTTGIVMPRLMVLALLFCVSLLTGVARAADGTEAPASPVADPDIVPAAVGEPAPEATDYGVPRATDPENCLLCHRYAGLSRLDDETGELRLFFVSEEHYAHREGPHTRLRCTDCHDREEVSKVPHDEATPVTCTNECHLVSPSGVATTYSHAAIAEKVQTSIHGDEAFDDLPFGEPLLQEGQSSCLYCHDEPVFGEAPDLLAHHGMNPGDRCDNCHTGDLGVDTKYYLHHVAGRLAPAKPATQQARDCAVCHTDQAVTEQYELHDAVSSYFRSFHGKAQLLGDPGTAGCLDCHSAEGGDPHGMMSADEPASPTNSENLAMTCRSAECHPNAAPEISAAAVHLRIDPRAPTLEFALMAFFTLLIAGVLGMYFALLTLEMAHEAFRRYTKHDRQQIALAEAVARHPEGRKRLERLDVGQRIQHFFLVVSFFILTLTGIPQKYADIPWMQNIPDMLGGFANLRLIHRVAGVVLIAAFAYHIVYLAVEASKSWRKRRKEQPDASGARIVWDIVWNFPLMPNLQDIKNLAATFAYLLGLRKEHPHLPKYHAPQKLEYFGVSWGMITIGTSGVILWAHAWITEYIGGRLLNFAWVVHSYEAFLAIGSIAVAHLTAVLLAPRVFPMSPAALTGQVPPAENAEGHSGFLHELVEEYGIEVSDNDLPPPAPWYQVALRRFYALTVMSITAVLGVATMYHLFQQLISPPPVVNLAEVPRRLTVDTVAMASLAGTSSLEGRGPVAHYHVIPSWFNQDPRNGCTESGCHEPLPHGDDKGSRAFLNMHSSFLDCQVCHVEAPVQTSDLAWIDLEDRQRRDPPSALRIADLAQRPMPKDKAALREWNRELIDALEEAADDAGPGSPFEKWALELDTVRLDGPMYAFHVEQLRSRAETFGRGEYGAKIGAPSLSLTPTAAQEEAAAKLVAEGEALPEAEQEALVETVHEGITTPEPRCTRCHGDESGLVDFEGLGYRTERAEELRATDTTRYSSAIESGETFYLPNVLSSVFGGGPFDDDPDEAAEPSDEAPGDSDEVPVDDGDGE